MKKTKIVFIWCVLLAALWGASCKKTTNNPTPQPKTTDTLVYDFSWTGTPDIDSVITFAATEPTGTTYLWNAGDTYSSYNTGTSASLQHTYQFTGVYTVTLVLNNDTAHKITKTITIFNNSISASFGYSGVPVVGNNLVFRAGEPYGTGYSWNFGDGSAISTASNPTHSYSSVGVYTVTMTINGSLTVTNPVTIYPAPTGTSGIGGSYHWSHKHIDNSSGIGPYDSSYTADSLMPVVLINSFTLVFLTDTFYYQPSTSTATSLVYSYSLYTNPIQNRYANGSIVFTPANDSLSCGIWTHPGPGQGVTSTDAYIGTP